MIDGSGRGRWALLALGLLAQAATCAFLYGLPMLVPQLRADRHLSLTQAGAVVAAPALGLLLTLILWGAAADRYGERWVIAAGLAGAAVLLTAATSADGVVALCALLAAAGAFAASVNAASGRLVMGWFDASERGLAMGIRQTGQPLGVAYAALALPPAAHRWGVGGALLVPALTCGLFAVLVAVLASDPPRAPRGSVAAGPSPYRVSTLWRLHAASALLVVPQFAISAYSLVYLVNVRYWDPTAAGRVIFLAQVLGAAGRIGSGVWSDRVGSRMGPMRQLACAAALVMIAAALGNRFDSPLVVLVLIVAAVITVADNGLAFIATAEFAGSAWAGRALGAQNTGQNVAATLTPPLLGALVTGHGYTVGFAAVATFPVLAIALTPVRDERRAKAPGPLEAPAPPAPPVPPVEQASSVV